MDKARPILPEQILGIDDTNLFIHTGSMKKNEWKIVDSEALKESGTYSIYETNENSELLNRIRVKLMTTYVASGYAAPLCLVVSRLDKSELIMTEEELRNSSGIYVLNVEGFSMNSNIDPQNK